MGKTILLDFLKITNSDFFYPAARNTKSTEMEPKASVTADTINHRPLVFSFWSLIRILVMTKFSGFILVDTLSIVFQFIFVHGIDQFTAVLFLGDLRTHKCCLPQEWNLFFTVM